MGVAAIVYPGVIVARIETALIPIKKAISTIDISVDPPLKAPKLSICFS
jgi:hypothetical protein